MRPLQRVFFVASSLLLLSGFKEAPKSSDSISTAHIPPALSDKLHFGRYWPIIRPYFLDETLQGEIADRIEEIEARKNLFQAFIAAERKGPYKELYQRFSRILAEGTIERLTLGGGGVYLLRDRHNTPQFIIKPEDEAILCLHNPKQRGSPFNDASHRLRENIPLYQSASIEAAVYAMAKSLGIENIVTATCIEIVSSSMFYDLSQIKAPREKLCSIQAFLPDSIDLYGAIHEWSEAHLDIESLVIDPCDFEYVNLLLWIIYDADGHSGNFRLFFKECGETGSAHYGIVKIDHALSLPEKNSHFVNYLTYLPGAKNPLSAHLKQTIAEIDIFALSSMLQHYGLSYAVPALEKRILLLKKIALRPNISIEEVSRRLDLLGVPNGENIALSDISLDELINGDFLIMH